ncbi:hypothetical protein SAZ_26155 [Streptomyces noursei ZPM]|nr:hypothetical protein SAZ_26155 [Streptomyces noursei ZPM]
MFPPGARGHAQVHRARPDVVAAAHCHSTYGRALSALGELLDPITQDVCAFYEDHALQAQNSTRFRRSAACGSRGSFAVDETLDQWIAEQVARAPQIPDETLRALARTLGIELAD